MIRVFQWLLGPGRAHLKILIVAVLGTSGFPLGPRLQPRGCDTVLE